MTVTRLGWVLTLLLLAAALWGPVPAKAAGSAGESLCDTPGAGVTCRCSEPLQESPGSVSGVWNPPNSTVAQCNGGNALDTTTGEVIAIGSVTGDALSGVTTVLKATSAEQGNMLHSNVVFTGGTFCSRSYEMFASDYTVPHHTGGDGQNPGCSGDCPRVKMVRWNGCTDLGTRDDPGMQSSSDGSCLGNSTLTTCEISFDPGGFGGPFGEMWQGLASLDLKINQLIGHWVRVEVCFDHVLPAETLTTRARWSRVDGTASGEASVVHSNTYPTASLMLGGSNGCGGMPLNLTSPSYTTSDRYAAYVMTASKATADPNFWIGPATEIEGILPPPLSVALSAAPSVIASGATSDVAWTIGGTATSCTFTSAPADTDWDDLTGTTLISGSHTVTLTASTAYTLACANATESAEDTTDVTVAVPTGVTLGSTQASIVEGQTVDLAWVVTGTPPTACTGTSTPTYTGAPAAWDSTAKAIGGGTDAGVAPTVTTTFSISCDGGAASEATVTVIPRIVISGMSLDTTTVVFGGSHVLSWSIDAGSPTDCWLFRPGYYLSPEWIDPVDNPHTVVPVTVHPSATYLLGCSSSAAGVSNTLRADVVVTESVPVDATVDIGAPNTRQNEYPVGPYVY